MSTKTSNFGLIKPDLTDSADITAMNENWDKIDEQLKKAGESGGTDLVETELASTIYGEDPEIDPVVENRLTPIEADVARVKSDLTEYKGKTDILESRPVNNNILINSNFANPVNQRGQSNYAITTGNIYTIDRWNLSTGARGGNVSLAFNEDSITVSLSSDGQAFSQTVEFFEQYKGKTLTFSAKIKNPSGTGNLKIYDGVSVSSAKMVEDGILTVTKTISGSATKLMAYFECGGTFSVDIEWAKLELGDHATPYVPRLYAEELELCKRYYQLVNEQSVIVYKYSDTLVMHCIDYKEMRTEPTPIIKESITYDSNGTFQTATEVTTDLTFKTFGRFKSTYPRAIRDNSYAVIFTVGLDAEL